MTLDFTAIDFETANSNRGSACSVGLVKVRDGCVVDQAETLIRPPALYDYFDGFNTCLHGICPEDVKDSPRWPEALSRIMRFAGTDVVVAHNAGFDLGVIRYACVAETMHWPSMDFLCTLVAARRAYRLPSYRLPFVAQQCGITLEHHHRASDDALAVAQIAVAMARELNVDTMAALGDLLTVRLGHMETGFYTASIWLRPQGHRGLVSPDGNPDADPDHPLYGRVVVLTGALMSMTRQMAWEAVAKVGGIPEYNVTKHTNVLVVGDINPAVLAPGMVLTGKAAKAFALQDKGQDIELMTEDDLLRSL
jgi:DNA polymerase III epsilon subunit-like protein